MITLYEHDFRKLMKVTRELLKIVENEYTGTNNKDLTGTNLILRSKEALRIKSISLD